MFAGTKAELMMEKQIQQLRKERGLSQEALADLAGLSIRTVQRLEAGVSKPRAFTVKTLADALQVEVEELTEAESRTSVGRKDYRPVKWMNLSILSQLILPFANIIFPLIIWRKWKKEKPTRELGASLISFQIWWTLFSLLIILSAPLISLAIAGQTQVGQFPMVGALYFLLIFVNVGLSLFVASDPETRAPRLYRRIPVLF